MFKVYLISTFSFTIDFHYFIIDDNVYFYGIQDVSKTTTTTMMIKQKIRHKNAQ